MDGAGRAVEAVDLDIQRATEKSAGYHQHFYRQALKVCVDQDLQVVADSVSSVTFELATSRVGVN